RQLPGDVLEPGRGQRLPGERLALPPELDARGDPGVRTKADPDTVQPGLPGERPGRLDPRGLLPPAPLKHGGPVDRNGQLAADMDPEADRVRLAQVEDAGPRHLERPWREARVWAGFPPGEGGLRVDADQSGGVAPGGERAVLGQQAGAQLDVFGV